VFVSGTAPGDHVEITGLTQHKGAAYGTLGRIVSAGPERVVPICPIASCCGGCDLMHVSQPGQRAAKLGILQDALSRIGGVVLETGSIGHVSVGDGLGYRSRLRLHVDSDGNIGFLSSRSNTLVPVPSCLVAEPIINDALARLSDVDGSGRRLLRLCEQLELRAADAEPKLVVRLFAKPNVRLHVPSFARIVPDNALVVLAGTLDDDRATQRYQLTDAVTALVPASAFAQVHRKLNARLVHDVVHAATLRGLRSFADAYAGAGNFTLPLLAAGLYGESIDSAAAGILAARSVAQELGLPFIGFNVGDAHEQLEALVRNHRQFDLVLLDPPRAGAKDVLPLALRLGPQCIAIVACDPVSLARDLKTLLSMGAKLESLTVYDMFPQTHHFETLALISPT
jgi:23S rRNA (uracil1939-C5)-methyltransferase